MLVVFGMREIVVIRGWTWVFFLTSVASVYQSQKRNIFLHKFLCHVFLARSMRISLDLIKSFNLNSASISASKHTVDSNDKAHISRIRLRSRRSANNQTKRDWTSKKYINFYRKSSRVPFLSRANVNIKCTLTSDALRTFIIGILA